MRVGLIPCTRPHVVGEAMASLTDCERVLVEFDRQRSGEPRTRNALIDRVDEDCELRFCDDDDVAWPIEPRIPLGADVLCVGYMVDKRVVQPPSDPLAAAVNYVINGNWLVRRGSLEFVRARFGTIYDPAWTMNTATRLWLRMIDTGLTFAFASTKIGYTWRRVPRQKRDHKLYAELHRRGARGVEERIAWDQGGGNA